MDREEYRINKKIETEGRPLADKYYMEHGINDFLKHFLKRNAKRKVVGIVRNDSYAMQGICKLDVQLKFETGDPVVLDEKFDHKCWDTTNVYIEIINSYGEYSWGANIGKNIAYVILNSDRTDIIDLIVFQVTAKFTSIFNLKNGLYAISKEGKKRGLVVPKEHLKKFSVNRLEPPISCEKATIDPWL